MMIETRAVAGDAYTRSQMDRGEFLTHAVVIDNGTEKVLCSRVRLANLLDDTCATDPNAAPTCPVCLKKWQKMQGQK